MRTIRSCASILVLIAMTAACGDSTTEAGDLSAITGNAIVIGNSAVSINGTVTGGAAGFLTYSTSAQLTNSQRVTQGPSATGQVVFEVNFLTPGTTYHYRVSATNGERTVHGSTRAFTLPQSPTGGS